MKKVIVILFLLNTIFRAQSGEIILDDDFGDWSNQYLLYSDKQNDGANGGLDFGKFYVTNDDKFIYFSIDVTKEINLQNDNGFTLYIDTDYNNSTGYSTRGIGADLVYSFGTRSGTYYSSNGEHEGIKHTYIGLVTSPTVTSTRFEIKMNLDSKIMGEKVFRNDSIRIVLADEPAGDVLPDSSGGIKYILKNNVRYSPPPYSLKKSDSDYLRVMAYNVHRDDLFDEARKSSFRDIFKAVNPDIIGLEEVYKHSAQDVADLINNFLPLNGGQWYAAKTNSDVLAVSKFPIISSYAIDGNAAFYIDLTKYGKKLLLIVAHTPCCDNDSGRQKEIDHFMSFLRDAKDSLGVLSLPKDSPIIIEGDMNLVGKARQVKTLLNGDILNENIYGKDFTPDWDGTPLDDSKPITTGLPTTFTWYSEGSSYPPGRLDYLVYSGSVLNLKNGFSLFIPALPADTLTAYGLKAIDADNASDHLPIVADFELPIKTNVLQNNNKNFGFKLFQNYPNPVGLHSSNNLTNITFSIPENTLNVTENKEENNTAIFKVYDLLGRTLSVKYLNGLQPGLHFIKFDTSSLSSGVYFYSITYSNLNLMKKMIVIH